MFMSRHLVIRHLILRHSVKSLQVTERMVISTEEKKKPTQAVALEYDPADNAPRVIAMGRGALADRIIEKAKDADIPVHRDDKLADTLSKLEIGDMIPPELYSAVAEILVFVDSMDKIKAKVNAYHEQKADGKRI